MNSQLERFRLDNTIGAVEGFRRSYLLGIGAIAASAAAALFVGYVYNQSESRAIAVVLLFVALAAAARIGVLGIALVLTATLPFLVIASSLLPPLTKTFTAGALVALVLLVAVPRRERSHASFFLRLGIVCFYAPVVLSLAAEGSREQFIQAMKYALFPLLVLAVTEATNRRNLSTLRTVALWSGLVAVVINLAIGATGFANFGFYYGAGEVVGLGSGHELALLAGCITAVCITASVSLRWWPAVAVGVIATVSTGVRSTLPGLALLAIGQMVLAGARLRTIALVAVAVAAAFAFGAAAVVEERFEAGESQGEFESFGAIGSGRGDIYASAIGHWAASSPIDWFFGTGLRSIPRFTEEDLGVAFVGHSDIVEVGVQLGIVGLIGLILIWVVLIARAKSKAPLVILASFAIFSGVLEYSAPLVIAVLLTAGSVEKLTARRNYRLPAHTEATNKT